MGPGEHISIPDAIIAITDLMQQAPGNESREELIALINKLIKDDFNTLVQLLYCIDVDEKKIRTCLQHNKNQDAAPVLANLIIERQLEKIESRRQFQQYDTESDEEKW